MFPAQADDETAMRPRRWHRYRAADDRLSRATNLVTTRYRKIPEPAVRIHQDIGRWMNCLMYLWGDDPPEVPADELESLLPVGTDSDTAPADLRIVVEMNEEAIRDRLRMLGLPGAVQHEVLAAMGTFKSALQSLDLNRARPSPGDGK